MDAAAAENTGKHRETPGNTGEHRETPGNTSGSGVVDTGVKPRCKPPTAARIMPGSDG